MLGFSKTQAAELRFALGITTHQVALNAVKQKISPTPPKEGGRDPEARDAE
jgi:hypothetical protein